LLTVSLGGVASITSPVQAATGHTVQDPPPSGDSGTTIDPLQYNCGNDAPSCGQVGESYGYYNGQNVDLLYTETYYCDPTITSHAADGCEVGAPASADPDLYSNSDTTLGTTFHHDTLYTPVPLFSNPPPTQCTADATCIDHPPTVDESAIAADLPGNPSPSSLDSVPIPAHNHVVGTRDGGLPEWWNVEVVATTDPATFNTLTSTAAITAALTAGTAIEVPTNIFLFFQVIPGTVPAAQAANLTATAPPGPAVATPPDADGVNVNQIEPGTTFDNLQNDCGATAPNCENIGLSHDWLAGQDVDALYTESYYCDTSVPAASSTGCEAGQDANTVPPGVDGGVVPTLDNPSPGGLDPVYTPTPIYASPAVPYTQCSMLIVCIDHPDTIDLSRLSSVLGAPAAALENVPLPSHDHLLTTRNGDQPEWWEIIAIPVTTPAGLAAVEKAKSYDAVAALENVPGSGVLGEVPTNAYLWFQTLPGSGPATPGPVQTDCATTLAAGAVVGGAALDDGTGYDEVDAKGDVATFGAATCYGDLTGTKLNQPIVGMAVDKTTGGYWLVGADGGVYAFNAPFDGSTGGLHLNKPIVGMAPTLNGDGYWLVASDGGVFSFGAAPFDGSTGALRLNQPVVGMGVDRETGGYWLVASDGGVFSFNAPFEGSTGGLTLNKPIVGMAPVSDGSGYRLIASDGGVFSFNAPFYGSTGAIALNKPVVTGLNNNSFDGYWLIASDGGVFTFSPPGEEMPFFGSAA
jgi:hypothetical protein